MIRKTAASLVCLALLAGTAHAGNVDFSIGINVGNRPVVASYEPVYAPAPPPVVIVEPPQFVLSPSLGFYVAMDIPHDLFYVGNRYYLSRDGAWYGGASYRGPWTTVKYRSLPRELRRYPVATIRHQRDRDYRHWCNDNDHRRWQSFRPERDRREVRREEKARWKEAKWREKEWRRNGRDRWDDD